MLYLEDPQPAVAAACAAKGAKFIDDEFDLSAEQEHEFACVGRAEQGTFDKAPGLTRTHRPCVCGQTIATRERLVADGQDPDAPAKCLNTLECGEIVSWRGCPGLFWSTDLANADWDWRGDANWIKWALPTGAPTGAGDESWGWMEASRIEALRLSDAASFHEDLEPRCLFDDSVNAADINQGSIGNCWLCAIFASFAATLPQTLRGLFSPAAISECGAYSVKLTINGKPRYILVDDYIICREGSDVAECYGGPGKKGAPLSVHSKNEHEAWPRLLEKVFAKLSGRHAYLSTHTFDPRFSQCCGHRDRILFCCQVQGH